jgi:hypothetical protein
MITSGFHATYPTAIDDEINLADNLYIAALFRWGKWRLPRVARTDPASVFSGMAYLRKRDLFGVPCGIVQGAPYEAHTRATNDAILTPSHAAWGEFQERLHAELQCPDFDERFGGARVLMQEEITTEYWPLCSANIIAMLGFAVAESLCLLRCFMGDDDREIHDHAASMWRKTKPRRGRVPFDADKVM